MRSTRAKPPLGLVIDDSRLEEGGRRCAPGPRRGAGGGRMTAAGAVPRPRHLVSTMTPGPSRRNTVCFRVAGATSTDRDTYGPGALRRFLSGGEGKEAQKMKKARSMATSSPTRFARGRQRSGDHGGQTRDAGDVVGGRGRWRVGVVAQRRGLVRGAG